MRDSDWSPGCTAIANRRRGISGRTEQASANSRFRVTLSAARANHKPTVSFVAMRNIPNFYDKMAVPASQTEEGKARLKEYWCLLGEFIDRSEERRVGKECRCGRAR